MNPPIDNAVNSNQIPAIFTPTTSSSASSSAPNVTVSHGIGPGPGPVHGTVPNMSLSGTMKILSWQRFGTPQRELQVFSPAIYLFPSAIVVPSGWVAADHEIAFNALVIPPGFVKEFGPVADPSTGYTQGAYRTWSLGANRGLEPNVHVAVTIITQTGTVHGAIITRAGRAPVPISFVDPAPLFRHATSLQTPPGPLTQSTTVYAGDAPMFGTLNQYDHPRSLPSWAGGLPEHIRAMIQHDLTASSPLPLYLARTPSGGGYLVADVRDPSGANGVHATLHFREKTDVNKNDGKQSLELVKIRATETHPDTLVQTTTLVQAPGDMENQPQQGRSNVNKTGSVSAVSLQEDAAGHGMDSTLSILSKRTRTNDSDTVESGGYAKQSKSDDGGSLVLDKGKKPAPLPGTSSSVGLSEINDLAIEWKSEALTGFDAELFDISSNMHEEPIALPPDGDVYGWNNRITGLQQLGGADRQIMIDYYRANEHLALMPNDGSLTTPMAFHKYLNESGWTSFRDVLAVLDTPLGCTPIQMFLEWFSGGKKADMLHRRRELTLFIDRLCETAPVKPKAWQAPAWMGPDDDWESLLDPHDDKISDGDKKALATYARRLWLGGADQARIRNALDVVRGVLKSKPEGFLQKLCNVSSEGELQALVEAELSGKKCTPDQRSKVVDVVRYMTNRAPKELIAGLHGLEDADRQAMLDYCRANEHLAFMPDDSRLVTPMAFHKYLNMSGRTSFQDFLATLGTEQWSTTIQMFLESITVDLKADTIHRRRELALFIDHVCEKATVKPAAWLKADAKWKKLLDRHAKKISANDREVLARYARRYWLGGVKDHTITVYLSILRGVLASKPEGFLDALREKFGNVESEEELERIVEAEVVRKKSSADESRGFLDLMRYENKSAAPGQGVNEKPLRRWKNTDDARGARAWGHRIMTARPTEGDVSASSARLKFNIEGVAQAIENSAPDAPPDIRKKALQSNRRWQEFVDSLKLDGTLHSSALRVLHSYIHITEFAASRAGKSLAAPARKYLDEWMVFRYDTKSRDTHHPEDKLGPARWNLAEFANDVPDKVWTKEVNACEAYCRANNRLPEKELADLRKTLNAFREWEQQRNAQSDPGTSSSTA
jgi:hypothetical protein